MVVRIANRKNLYGRFTAHEEIPLTIGNKIIQGTPEISDINILTVRFPYTVDRLTSLPKTTLKTAECLGGNTVSVTWNKVPNASGYRIYRKTAKTSWKRISTVPSPDTLSYTDASVKPGITYYYTVRALRHNPDGTSILGGCDTTGISVKTFISAPVLVSTTSYTAGMRIKWKKAEGATAYRIYRKTPSSNWKRVVPKLAAPKLLRAERDNYYGLHNWGFTYAVLLEWTPVKNAKYYCIYRRKAGSSKWIRLAKQPAYDRTTYFDSDIGLSTSYYYTVRPVICSYYGEFSRTGIYSEKDFELDIW